MNYSERLALAYVDKTRDLISDPAFLVSDWSVALIYVAAAFIVLICIELVVE